MTMSALDQGPEHHVTLLDPQLKDKPRQDGEFAGVVAEAGRFAGATPTTKGEAAVNDGDELYVTGKSVQKLSMRPKLTN
jgi:hypothetical protein